MKIEAVTLDDAEELLAIYAPYVSDTAVSFEYEVPSLDEFRKRIETISSLLPYIKISDDSGRILGYSYAGKFKERKAYDHSVEMTIYLREDCRHMGIGQILYGKMEELLKAVNITNINACIAVAGENDPYLTDDSERFHKHFGYKMVGTFHQSGYKFGRWYDMIWMEKMIGEHSDKPKAVEFGKWKEYM